MPVLETILVAALGAYVLGRLGEALWGKYSPSVKVSAQRQAEFLSLKARFGESAKGQELAQQAETRHRREDKGQRAFQQTIAAVVVGLATLPVAVMVLFAIVELV